MNSHCGWKGTCRSVGLLVLRLMMGLAMAYHGYQKLFTGVFDQLVEGLTMMNFPIPVAMAWAAALSEFVGGLMIAFGLGTRIGAFLVLIVMSVAYFVAHGNDPFQVKELPYLFGAVALALILTGPGRFSLDRLFFCRKKGGETETK